MSHLSESSLQLVLNNAKDSNGKLKQQGRDFFASKGKIAPCYFAIWKPNPNPNSNSYTNPNPNSNPNPNPNPKQGKNTTGILPLTQTENI